MSELAQLLRQWRRRSGMSQVQLARAAGISAAALETYEYGRRVPPEAVAARLAVALGLDAAEQALLAEAITRRGE